MCIYDLLYLLLSGFRLDHSCQAALTFMIGRWLKAVDKGKLIGAVFLDLAKAFDLLGHELLLQKLQEHFATVIFFLFERQKTDCFYFKYIFRFTTSVEFLT
jgi:hypothetical protein